MKKQKLLLWGLCAMSALLLSLPYLLPHSGFLMLFALIPLLCMDRIASLTGLKHVWIYHYSTFVAWNAMTTFWVCNATAGGGLFAIFANALQMSLIWGLFRYSKKYFKGILPYVLLVSLWIGWEHAYFDAEISWPWLVLGNGFAGSIRSIQWYEFTGTVGGSLWIWLCNLSIFGLMTALSDGSWYSFNKKAKTAAITATLLLFIAPFILSAVLWHRNDPADFKGEEQEILIVQPNIDPYHKFEFLQQEDQDKIALEQIDEVLSQRTSTAPILVLTPETFTGDAVIRNGSVSSRTAMGFQAAARRYPNSSYLVGASTYEILQQGDRPSLRAREWGDGWMRSHNSALYITGNDIDIFHKNKLVVGVEYMPWPTIFDPVDQWLGGVIGRCEGQGRITDFTLKDSRDGAETRFGSAICYESVYGEYYTGYVRKGARFMTIITNDSWWGDTPGYKQHMNYASLRAIETRREIARCANTGISGFIDLRGEIKGESKWWEKEVLQGKVLLHDELTFFVRHGDVAGRVCWFSGALLLLALLVQRLNSRKKTAGTLRRQ